MPTIIDSLLITLGLDTKGVKTGEKEAENSLKDLERHSRESANAIKEQGAVAGEFYDTLLEKAATFFAFIAGGMELKEFVKNTMEGELSALRLSEMLKMNIEDFQKWQGAVVIAGGTAQGFGQSMKMLGGFLVDIKTGTRGAERALKVLQAAGVTGLAKGKYTPVAEVLDQLSTKMSKLDMMSATRLGMRMGLDEAFVRVLHRSTEGIKALKDAAADAGMFTKEESDAVEVLEERLNLLGLRGKTIAREALMGAIRPALEYVTGLLEQIAAWAQKHPNDVKAIFVGIASALAAASVAAVALTVSLSPVMAAVIGAGVAVGVLAGAAYELYSEWDKWLPEAEKLLPGSKGTLQVARQGMNDLTAMYRAWWSGNDALAEHYAQEYWDKFANVGNRVLRQLSQYLIREIIYRPIYAIMDLFKGDNIFKNLKHLDPTMSMRVLDFLTGGVPAGFGLSGGRVLSPKPVPRRTTYQIGADYDMGRDAGVGTNFGAAVMAPHVSMHVDSITIATPTSDPAEHAELFMEHINQSLGHRLSLTFDKGLR